MHEIPSDCRRLRVFEWAAPVFGLLWLVVPVVDFADNADPAAWQVALVAAGLAAFAWQFLEVVTLRRAVLRPVIAIVAISVTLTLVAYDSFALMFVWAAAAAGVRLEGHANVFAVAAITAIAAATLALTDPEAAVFWGITSTVFATGALWLLIGGLLRANTALREAARRAGRARRCRGAAPVRPRPARPARAQPLADRAQGGAGREASPAAGRRRRRRDRRHPRADAQRAERGARGGRRLPAPHAHQ
jgi:hypothetical protein